MEYIYEIYEKSTANKLHTCTRLEEIENLFLIKGEYNFTNEYVEIYRGDARHDAPKIMCITCQSDLIDWRNKLERDAAWRPDKVDELPQAGRKYHVEDDGFHIDDALAPGTIWEVRESPTEDPINPQHYQGYLGRLQWLETMSRIPEYKNDPAAFAKAVKLQVRKYLDRDERKGEQLQDAEKALWYLKFYVAFLKNDKQPILVDHIEGILNGSI